jgi:catechol 2,3-dioxygenase-like lactoylglutathione lyase family enzyme
MASATPAPALEPPAIDAVPYSVEVTSSALFVGELGRSVAFYRDLLGCSVTVHEPKAALLLTRSGFQLYLVERGPRAPHSMDGIGSQGLMWSTGSAAELQAIAVALTAVGAYVDTHHEGGVTFVEGRDPDGLRVVVAFPGPDVLPRSMIAARFY